MYMGGGIGLIINFDGYASIPVFLDMKYNIFDWTLSPYLDCRVGMEVLSAGDYLAFMALPGSGFDYHKISFRKVTNAKPDMLLNFILYQSEQQ